MQKVEKKRLVIDASGYELSKKVIKRLIDKENSA
jgi:hypothetical protein